MTEEEEDEDEVKPLKLLRRSPAPEEGLLKEALADGVARLVEDTMAMRSAVGMGSETEPGMVS